MLSLSIKPMQIDHIRHGIFVWYIDAFSMNERNAAEDCNGKLLYDVRSDFEI
jgi:hypothetical protein